MTAELLYRLGPMEKGRKADLIMQTTVVQQIPQPPRIGSTAGVSQEPHVLPKRQLRQTRPDGRTLEARVNRDGPSFPANHGEDLRETGGEPAE